MTPTEHYPYQPLTSIKEQPIATAKFKEPIFRLGEFQNDFIEVDVALYPISVRDEATGKVLVGVRFGQMQVIRFVDRDLIYDIERFPSKPLDNQSKIA